MPTRHLPFALILCRHSEFPPFLWLTSLPLRATSSSPHIAVINPLALISIPASRESGVLSQRSISTLRKFDLRGSDFTAQWGRSVGGFCIFRGGARGERKNDVQRGGGCAKPLRGQAPVTPKRLLHSRFASATHYKTEIFVDGTRADAIDLPDMQIFKAQF